jgi:hypothetical protein
MPRRNVRGFDAVFGSDNRSLAPIRDELSHCCDCVIGAQLSGQSNRSTAMMPMVCAGRSCLGALGFLCFWPIDGVETGVWDGAGHRGRGESLFSLLRIRETPKSEIWQDKDRSRKRIRHSTRGTARGLFGSPSFLPCASEAILAGGA